MGKRRVGRYPRAFRQMAVDRLRKCDNVVALSEELGVHRRLLYKWRLQLDPLEADGIVDTRRGLRGHLT
jgi:transposase-like protein